MSDREERLYFAVHGLEPTTVRELNAKLEAELARGRGRYEERESGVQTEDSRRGGPSGDSDGHRGEP